MLFTNTQATEQSRPRTPRARLRPEGADPVQGLDKHGFQASCSYADDTLRADACSMPGTLSNREVGHFCRVDQCDIGVRFSEDDRQNADFRYLLDIPYTGRTGNETVCVVLKNPSRADESQADNTIRRIEEYVWCRFERCRRLHILNLFAYRSTEVSELWRRMDCHLDIVGPENDHFLRESFRESNYIIGAWGGPTKARVTHRTQYYCRIAHVVRLLRPHADKLWQVAAPRAASGSRSRSRRRLADDEDAAKSSWVPLHGLRWAYKFDLREWRPAFI